MQPPPAFDAELLNYDMTKKTQASPCVMQTRFRGIPPTANSAHRQRTASSVRHILL